MSRIVAYALFFAAAFLPASPAVARPDVPSVPQLLPVSGGSLTLKVPDFLRARDEVIAVATGVGAQITAGETFVNAKGRKNGSVRLNVSADRLPELLPRLRRVGVLASDNLTTVEHGGEHAELGGRIGQLRKHETRLDTLLNSRRNLRGSDILYIQERLFRAGVDEEQLMQARAAIEQRSRTAQITVTLFEPLPVIAPVTPIVAAQNSFAHGFTNSRKRAEWRRDQLLSRIATGFAFALVYAPLWLPLFLVAVFVCRFVWLRRAVLVRAVSPYLLALRDRIHEFLKKPELPSAAENPPG